jgi:F-type H+-transporting ATPase subunit alpha
MTTGEGASSGIAGEILALRGRVNAALSEESGSRLRVREVGRLRSVGEGVAMVDGLPGVAAEELLILGGGVPGWAFDISEDCVGVVLLGSGEGLAAGEEVRRTGRTLDVPVGARLLGRIVDALGEPLDGQGPIRASTRLPTEREAPGIMDRAAVTVPLETGVKVIDALIPIGRGQRQLIVGDRQTGKTAVAVDTIINQRDTGVVCVYCTIGQRAAGVAQVIDDLRRRDALAHCVVVAASGEDPPGLRVVAPYAAMSIAEHFMSQGRDALVVFDDLVQHARAYRELSLLMRRPPGREAFPGDIFHLHARLLERSTHLNEKLGGGSVTALPIVETQAQNIAAYIPTNLISITDGQIYLSPDLFRRGTLPAVDVGRSVSRVGGKTQLAAYRAVAGDLRLKYSQFEELESFSRFAAHLDAQTEAALRRGRRIREVLKQPQADPMPIPEQIAVLLAAAEGVLDRVPRAEVGRAELAIRRIMNDRFSDLGAEMLKGKALSDQARKAMLDAATDVVRPLARNDEEPGVADGHAGSPAKTP